MRGKEPWMIETQIGRGEYSHWNTSTEDIPRFITLENTQEVTISSGGKELSL
jgi:hypothetical protein